jgi:hypothetical protein
VPLRTAAGTPEPDPRLRAGIALPDHVSSLTRGIPVEGVGAARAPDSGGT